MLEKIKCPMCNHILYKKHEGLACKNWKCKLFSKLGKGWFLITDKIKTEKENISSGFINVRSTFKFQYEWANIKKEILIRDNFTCQRCNYEINNRLLFSNHNLEVHHIIPVLNFSPMALDKENLITLCDTCHKLAHKNDKYKFK